MAWVKVPPENHPKFHAALPVDPRVEIKKLFGGVAAKVNGRLFAGLFGRSTMIWLPEEERGAALSLQGASPFDPMGDGRRSDKVMLPESMMHDSAELRRWIGRAFEATAALPSPSSGAAPSPKPARASQSTLPRKPTTIEEYLATVSAEKRSALNRLRQTIRSIVPKADECISYQIPAFRVNGKVVAGFSATAKGCSYFPFSGSTLRTLARDLGAYSQTKSALHFDPGKGLPTALVRKLLQARIAEGTNRKASRARRGGSPTRVAPKKARRAGR